MFSIHTALFLTIFCASVYHLIPQRWWSARLTLVCLTSFVLIFSLHPMAAIVALLCAILTWGIHKVGLTRPTVQKYAPFSLFLILAVFSLKDFSIESAPYSKAILNFGMSFYILRLYGSLRVARKKKVELKFLEFVTVTLFFPMFAAGPIAYYDSFRPHIEAPFLISDWVYGLVRIGAGAFCLYFATGYIDGLINDIVGAKFNAAPRWDKLSAWETYKVTMLKFFHLYMNFTGYTEIAIGCGSFFGFKLPENFRFPFLSRNIQDFWKRWHLSLSSFITNHIYLPLVIKTGFKHPKISIFVAFVLIGLWHEISWQYLFWGVGHGAALVCYQTVSKTKRWKARSTSVKNMCTIPGIVVTLSYVGFLSVFANEATFGRSIEFMSALFGFGV